MSLVEKKPSNLSSWLMAARPKTLTAALVPIVVVSAWLQGTGQIWDWKLSLYAFLSAILIQIGTNLINDAVDFEKGADTEERLGPTRVTQAGHFSAKQVWAAGHLCFALALLFGIPLVIAGGWTLVVIGLVSILCGYFYTAGPYPLAYKGLGDLFVILFFGLVATLGLSFVFIHQFTGAAFIMGLQVGLLSTVLIAVNNLRDYLGDRLVEKMTLPARFGLNFGRVSITVYAFTPFALQLYWWEHELSKAALLPLLMLPLAIHIVRQVFRTEPSSLYNQILAKAAGLHLGFGLLLSLGFLL